MKITKGNIDEIKLYLHTHGIENEMLMIELTDHFSCEIEERMAQGATYEKAFGALQEAFPSARLQSIEAERTYYLTTKSNITMLKAVFITGYISIVMMILGGFFVKLSFTPSFIPLILWVGGILCFCFAFLPTLFIFFYRKAVHWAKE